MIFFHRATLMLVLMLTLLSAPTIVCQAVEPTSTVASPDSLQWSPAEFKKLRSILEFENDALSQADMKFQDVRLSPMIRSEQWYEIPVEIGFVTAEDNLPAFLKKTNAFSVANATLGHKSINVSQTAETLPNGKQLLSVMINQTVVVGQSTGTTQGDRLVKGMAQILALTTFEPRIRRGGGELPKNASHWITNLRIDGDLRVQLTGYGLSFTAVVELAEKLYQSGVFAEVFLSNINRNVFEKQPVWRFDLTGRISFSE